MLCSGVQVVRFLDINLRTYLTITELTDKGVQSVKIFVARLRCSTLFGKIFFPVQVIQRAEQHGIFHSCATAISVNHPGVDDVNAFLYALVAAKTCALLVYRYGAGAHQVIHVMPIETAALFRHHEGCVCLRRGLEQAQGVVQRSCGVFVYLIHKLDDTPHPYVVKGRIRLERGYLGSIVAVSLHQTGIVVCQQ